MLPRMVTVPNNFSHLEVRLLPAKPRYLLCCASNHHFIPTTTGPNSMSYFHLSTISASATTFAPVVATRLGRNRESPESSQRWDPASE